MRISLVFGLAAMLLASDQIQAQSKAGTTGARFLEISPSICANGMGLAGVALADDQGWYLNPALTGIAGLDHRLMLSPYVWMDNGSVGYSSTGFTFTFPSRSNDPSARRSLVVGYHYTHEEAEPVKEVDYFGVPTGRTFWWEDYAHQLTVSYAVRRKVEFAAGMTAKYFRETVHDYYADGGAVDLGLYFSRPITILSGQSTHQLKPSIAAAVANWGPDVSMIRDSYPLPHIWRFGLGMIWGYDRPGAYERWERLHLGFGFDVDRYFSGVWYTGMGLESRMFEAVAFRVGGVWGNNRRDATYGFSLYLSGLTKGMIALFGDPQQPGKLGRFLMNRVTVSYSEAHGDTEYQYADASRGFVLAVPLN